MMHDSDKSRLQRAIETPVEELTDEQKVLLNNCVDSLTDEQREKYASILTPKGE